MVTMASIMKAGGKKYLPETDYLAQIKLAKLDRKEDGTLRLKYSLVIVDTLPEGAMDAMAGDLKENEKFPGDERLFDMLTFPNENMKPSQVEFHGPKLAAFMVGCGIMASDENGELSLLDEDIDLNDEPTPEWFLDRYIGIKIGRKHHWADKAKLKPVEDTILEFLPVPEEA